MEKNMKLKVGVLLIGLLFVLNACYYDQVLPFEPPIIDVGENVSFSADIIPIFNAACNTSGCHNGAVPPDLSPGKAHAALINGNYINTSSPEESELYLWMRGKRSMPMPLTGPDPTYNATVLAWIKQGALNN
jgi:hypothetical protein